MRNDTRVAFMRGLPKAGAACACNVYTVGNDCNDCNDWMAGNTAGELLRINDEG